VGDGDGTRGKVEAGEGGEPAGDARPDGEGDLKVGGGSTGRRREILWMVRCGYRRFVLGPPRTVQIVRFKNIFVQTLLVCCVIWGICELGLAQGYLNLGKG